MFYGFVVNKESESESESDRVRYRYLSLVFRNPDKYTQPAITQSSTSIQTRQQCNVVQPSLIYHTAAHRRPSQHRTNTGITNRPTDNEE